MENGKRKILTILNSFTGRDGEPNDEYEFYILLALWVMMLSEFESSIKALIEDYITEIKRKDILDIHICLLIRNFHGNKEDELTLNKIISFYKKKTDDISFANFTKDRVPKYKYQSVVKLFNNVGIFFNDEEHNSIRFLDGLASTRDSIAHGDHGVGITAYEIKNNLEKLENLLNILKNKLSNALE